MNIRAVHFNSENKSGTVFKEKKKFITKFSLLCQMSFYVSVFGNLS